MPKRRVKRHAVTQPLDASYRLIPLTRTQNAIVDIEDFIWLSERTWTAAWNKRTQSFYAKSDYPSPVLMHRLILGCGKKEQGDHRNHDTLDNRRNNLRKCTHSENARNARILKPNSSGYKGVTWDSSRNKWKAQIGIGPRGSWKNIFLGRFDNPEDAALSYNEAARKYFGEFAHLNVL